MNMYKARVVLFFEDRKLNTAICLEDKGSRLHVLTSEGREMNVNLNRVLQISSYSLDLTLSRDSLLKKIEAINQKQIDLMRQVDVFYLWELLLGEGEVFDLASLSRLVFGEAADSDHGGAVLRSLMEDRTRFKLKGKQFQINTPEQIRMIETKRDMEDRRQRDIEEGSLWLQSIMQGKAVSGAREELFIGLLKEFVLFGSEAPNYQLIREMLDQAKLGDQKACFDILVRHGVFDADENLFLHRYQVPIKWPQAVVDETEVITQEYGRLLNRNKVRHDFTHLQIFSIDDYFTQDVDDAISFEEHADYFQLGVHITDVASFIAPESALDRAAAKRATSIYLPEGKIPMLPPHLSEELLSLTEGEKRPALSFFIKLSHAGEVLDKELLLSFIKITKKMTYAEVDAAIEENPLFAQLYRLTAVLMDKRIQEGALLLPIPELQVVVDSQKHIRVGLRERTTPSQIIVSECMILANNLAAQLLHEKDLPAIYRKQSQPRESIPLPAQPALFHLVRQRKVLSRVEVGIEPGLHHSLGRNLYTTISSPLRKYYDLVMQRQLVSVLSEKPPVYGKNDLRNLVNEAEPCLTRAAIVEQERERYWLLKYLEDKKGERFSALVLDKRARSYSILINDYLLETNLSVVEGAELAPGETITVVLEKVDPFNGTLKVSLLNH